MGTTIIKEGAPLQDEYNNLYRAIFNKPEQYIKIIEALSNVTKGITRDVICKKTKIPSSGELTLHDYQHSISNYFIDFVLWIKYVTKCKISASFYKG